MAYIGKNPTSVPLTSSDLADSIVTSAKIVDGTILNADLASNAVDTQALSLFNASGSAPVYACRAWVNFDGTGTVAIRGSGNVSSITDNGTGLYTINFTTAMSDTNYSALYSVSGVSGSVIVKGAVGGTYSTSAVQILCFVAGGADTDVPTVGVSIFR